MDPEPHIINLLLIKPDWANHLSTIIFLLLGVVVMLLISVITSAAENAFFSLKPTDIKKLENSDEIWATTALDLINENGKQNGSKKLLATILLVNNFTNIAVVISTSIIIAQIFNFENNLLLGFLIEVVFITFLIVLISEVTPKIYATNNNITVVKKTANFIKIAQKIVSPFSYLLMITSSLFDKYAEKQSHTVSLDELNQAIDITTHHDLTDEKAILKGLVNFGNISAKQIMVSRLDINALDTELSNEEVIEKAKLFGFSRLPVYKEELDVIIGILYIKDLIPYLGKSETFEWNSLIRNPYFVHENKKIDDLLNDFKTKHTHMAIVVDEYGSTQGIITLEDILEEIFGEIKDEFDDEDTFFQKIDKHTYLFEAKTSLNDFCKVVEIEKDFFDEGRGEKDSIAGLILEIAEKIPKKGEMIKYKNITFVIEAADIRKIKKVKIILDE